MSSRNRCCVCNKRIPSLFISISVCRCGKMVCAKHKSEKLHNCTFDWKNYGESILKESLAAARAPLVDKI